MDKGWGKGKFIKWKLDGRIQGIDLGCWLTKNDPRCVYCEQNFMMLLDNMRGGLYKKWPKTVYSMLPEEVKGEFTRAYLEGKIKKEG